MVTQPTCRILSNCVGRCRRTDYGRADTSRRIPVLGRRKPRTAAAKYLARTYVFLLYLILSNHVGFCRAQSRGPAGSPGEGEGGRGYPAAIEFRRAGSPPSVSRLVEPCRILSNPVARLAGSSGKGEGSRGKPAVKLRPND